ncbi:hypothetical protein BH20ACT18_BH20ACT18_01430 [soil metagenome]
MHELGHCFLPSCRGHSLPYIREHLDIGRVFSAISDLYKTNVAPLLVAALIVFVPVAIVSALLQSINPLLVLLVIPVGIVAQAVYLGTVIELVNRVHSGAAVPGVGELFQTALPHVGRLVVTGFVAGLGIVVGLVLLIVPGLYLATIWAVFAPVVVLERAGVTGSLGRSHQLVKGDGWQVFFIVFVIGLVTQIFAAIIGVALGSSFVGNSLASLLPSLLLGPVSALAAVVIYFELRRLKEGGGVRGAPTAAGVPGGQPAYPPAQPSPYPEQPGSQPPPTAPYQQPPPPSPGPQFGG